MSPSPFHPLLTQALERRKPLLERLHSENTDAYRIFHGVSEGRTGLTIDRYGSLLLLQTFREPLSPAERQEIEDSLRAVLPGPHAVAYNHRGKSATESFEQWHTPDAAAASETECREFGVRFLIRARHQGLDPWLFLDLRAGRRYLRDHIKDSSLLNLFSYTCSVGLSALHAGAREVWNVDFSSSSLEVGRRNRALNRLPEERIRMIDEDCIPVMRQLAGLPAGGRRKTQGQFQKFEARQFDWVVLDPPAWSKGPFGAVDVVGDYGSLFKPAVLAAKPGGGRILATHHVPSVAFADWAELLARCAAKAGRPLRDVRQLLPEEDFPSFDGRPPLKIAVCEV